MTRDTVDRMRIDSPVGPIEICSNGRALTEVRFLSEKRRRASSAVSARGSGGRTQSPRPASASRTESTHLGGKTDLLQRAARQLEAYFQGRRKEFALPLDPEGTPFQKQVWEELQRIPFGETVSYKEIARRIGRPTATRAVGLANGRNPLAIVIPCHRVIGQDGSLTGYGGGLPIKRRLLDMESGTRSLFD